MMYKIYTYTTFMITFQNKKEKLDFGNRINNNLGNSNSKCLLCSVFKNLSLR